MNFQQKTKCTSLTPNELKATLFLADLNVRFADEASTLVVICVHTCAYTRLKNRSSASTARSRFLSHQRFGTTPGSTRGKSLTSAKCVTSPTRNQQDYELIRNRQGIGHCTKQRRLQPSSQKASTMKQLSVNFHQTLLIQKASRNSYFLLIKKNNNYYNIRNKYV